MTRASVRHRCPPPSHSLECDILPQTDPIETNVTVTVDFWNYDHGLPDDDPLDHVQFTASAGTWNPPPPVPFFNRQTKHINWTAPADAGHYLLTATYWWSDGHSCHTEHTIEVEEPLP